jgi:hypothetical protein
MQLVGPGEGPFRNGVARRYDDVMIVEVKLLDRERGEREIVPVRLFGEWKLLNKRGLHGLSLQKITLLVRDKIDQAVKLRIREHLNHLLEDALSPGIHRQPVVDESNVIWQRSIGMISITDWCTLSTVILAVEL